MYEDNNTFFVFFMLVIILEFCNFMLQMIGLDIWVLTEIPVKLRFMKPSYHNLHSHLLPPHEPNLDELKKI